jgi:predicted ester cyclase
VFPPAPNEGDFVPADKYIAADIVDNFDHSQGIESFKEVIEMFHRAFPDVRLTVIDAIAEGDKVVHRWAMPGTHRGEFMGIHPTGKRLTGFFDLRPAYLSPSCDGRSGTTDRHR